MYVGAWHESKWARLKWQTVTDAAQNELIMCFEVMMALVSSIFVTFALHDIANLELFGELFNEFNVDWYERLQCKF